MPINIYARAYISSVDKRHKSVCDLIGVVRTPFPVEIFGNHIFFKRTKNETNGGEIAPKKGVIMSVLTVGMQEVLGELTAQEQYIIINDKVDHNNSSTAKKLDYPKPSKMHMSKRIRTSTSFIPKNPLPVNAILR